MDFLNELDSLQKIFWYIAIPVSVIFVVQAILTFTGLDALDGTDADFDGNLEGGDTLFQLFSLRNLINFLLGFSWTGIALYGRIANHNVLIFLAVLIGLIFVAFFFLIAKQLMKLAENNSFNIQDILHQTCTVYLTIPAAKSGKGKIQISVKGSVREIDAVTLSKERIETGSLVYIIGIEGNHLVIVEKV